MTYKQMGCDKNETERRISVCNRLNVLAHKRDNTDDPKTRKRIDRNISVILRQERPWMKDIVFFAY